MCSVIQVLSPVCWKKVMDEFYHVCVGNLGRCEGSLECWPVDGVELLLGPFVFSLYVVG